MIKGDTVYTSWDFDLVDIDGVIAMSPNKLTVLVLPYAADNRGVPAEIGVVNEKTPNVESGLLRTAVAGVTADEDPDVLATAQAAMLALGYDCSDPVRWFFLGFVYGSKTDPQQYPCFACDITGITSSEESTLQLLSVHEALDTDDAFVPALFLKMFRYMFGFGKPDPNAVVAPEEDDEKKTKQGEEEEIQNLTDEESAKLLAIDGVISAKAGEKEVTVTVRNESPAINSAIEKILGERAFKVVITPDIIPTEVGGSKDKEGKK